MQQSLGFLLLVTALLSSCNTYDWMAGGTFTQADFGTLRAKVNTFDPESDPSTFGPKATSMSNQLNLLWAPAWNVVIVHSQLTNNFDSVLYGYAFNGHWFWQNGFLLKSKYYASIIIWKDFNCNMWVTYNPSEFSTYRQYNYNNGMNDALTNKIQSTAFDSTNDIWVVAQNLQAKIPTASSQFFQDKTAYTIVASQSPSVTFYGQFCAFSFTRVGNIGRVGGTPMGTALILQMRSS